MNIVIINALGNYAIQRCINSLYATTPDNKFDLYVFRETGFREQTLNKALKVVGTDKDVLILGDDILLTQGWFEILMTYYSEADILGMSMLYPDTTKIQDRGYDLVQIDDQVTIEAADRGRDKQEVSQFGFRLVDALCGCFVFVKSNILKKVNEFSEEGQNRFGEFIFLCETREQGAKIGVIDHFLYHSGISTKSNPDKKLGSISYSFEKKIWQHIVSKYVDKSWVKNRIQQVVSAELANLLTATTGRILVYGIGTVTEFLGTQFDFYSARFTFCTGLREEAGMKVFDKPVEHIKDLKFNNFSIILITPLFIANKIYRQALNPLLPETFDSPVYAIEADKNSEEIKYNIKELTH